MSDYTTPEKVADYLSHIDLAVIREEPGTISPHHVRYQLALTRYGKEFRTSFESNPEFHGKPDITQVFSTLLSDDMYMSESRNLAEYLDNEVANGIQPSKALSTYESLKKTHEWLHDELALTNGEMQELYDTIEDDEKAVANLVDRIQTERAEKESFEHPPVPEGFVTIDDLKADLDLGEFGDQVEMTSTYLDDDLRDCADSNIDIYYSDLIKWLPGNEGWVEEADASGLLEGCKGDIHKMIQMGQYECFSQELYDHREDINKNVTLSALADAGVYAVSESAAADLNDLDFKDSESTLEDEAIDQLFESMYSELEDKYGEDFAVGVTDNARADKSFQLVNPVAMSVEMVREVNGKGYAAAFAECHKELLDHCELAPDGTSLAEKSPDLESESRDMESAKDAVNGPEQATETPEKATDKPEI